MRVADEAREQTIGFSTKPGDPLPASVIDFQALSLEQLRDRAEISDLVYRYGAGLDFQDWTLWRSIFLDPVWIDLSDFVPEPPPRLLPVDVQVKAARTMFRGFTATQHLMMNHRIALDGDTATLVAPMRAEHWIDNPGGPDRFTMFGYYTDDFVRTDAGWRIARVRLSLTRVEGDREVMNIALRRGRELLGK